jgi:hypothetical protein
MVSTNSAVEGCAHCPRTMTRIVSTPWARTNPCSTVCVRSSLLTRKESSTGVSARRLRTMISGST